jgi:hypothetical protein
MSSKPHDSNSNSSDADRQPLPFEPVKSRKQADRKAEQKAAKKPVTAAANPSPSTAAKSSSPQPTYRSATGIPETVSRRMVKRMAVFCGLPTLLGMSTFVVSYLVITNGLYEVPTYAVLLVSLGFFGLGVLGLSYGALSASWDEETPGSRLGLAEFATNWGRMTGTWQAERKAAQKAARDAARKKS